MPFGVMTGYIIASVLTSISQHQNTCLGLLCWRWPFLIEVMLLTPLYFGLYFVRNEDLAVCSDRNTENTDKKSTKASPQDNNSNTTAPMSESHQGSYESMARAERVHSAVFASKQGGAAEITSRGPDRPGNPFVFDSPSQDSRTNSGTQHDQQVLCIR